MSKNKTGINVRRRILHLFRRNTEQRIWVGFLETPFNTRINSPI